MQRFTLPPRGRAGTAAPIFHDTTESAMQLYYNPMSSSARRVLLTIAHLGLTLDMRMVTNMLEPAQRAALLRVNPNAKVPVLVDGEFVLWESCAIMQYLAEKTPGQTLFPQDLRSRMDVQRWMYWGAQHWQPLLGIYNWENHIKRWLGMGAGDPQALARADGELQRFGAVLDAHLAGREWVSGDHLTLADFTLSSALADIEAAKMPMQPYPNILAWLERLRTLPAWQAVAQPQ
jgi:glutathione S-transferase